MALTQSQVSALYVAIFGRASEGEANKKWQKSASLIDVAKEMLKSDEAKKLFGTSLDSDKAFIDFIYANVLGKGAGIDQAGKDFWINKLKAGSDKAAIMSDIIHAAMDTKYASSSDTATKNAFNLFVNKVALSNIVSETVEKLPEGGVKALQEINKAVKPATKVAEVKNLITANEALKSAVDTTKLEKAATANDPAKVIANVTGAKAEEITKILKENPVVSTNDSGSSSQGSSDTGSSNNPGDSGSAGSGSGGSSGSSSGGAGTDDITEVSHDGFYKFFGTSSDLTLKLQGVDGVWKKGDKLYQDAQATQEINLADDASLSVVVVKRDASGDSSHYIFNAPKSDTVGAIKAWDDAAILAIVDEDATLTKGGLTYKFDDSHKVKEVKKDGAAITGADIDSLSDVLAGKFAINGIAFAASTNDYAFTTENLAKMATLVGAGDNPFADDVIAKVADGATITAENFKELDVKIDAAVTTLRVVDTAENIKNALDSLVAHVAKVASIDASNVGGGNDDSEIAMTKTQFGTLKDKLDAGDTIKVTDLAAGDVAIAGDDKVDFFTMDGGNTITVNAEQLTALKAKASDNALKVEGKGTELKTTLVALSDSELAKIKNASIDLKGETGGEDGEIELTLTEFSKLGTKFSGTTGTDTITVTDVTGGVAASAAKDVFKLGAGATGLNITGFAATDKIDVTALIADQDTFTKQDAPSSVKVENGKFYVVDGSGINEITAETNIATDFGKLFAGSGTAFKDTDSGATAAKAIVAVKLSSGAYKLYAINNPDDSTGDGEQTIAQEEVTIVGTAAGAFDVSNIETNFTLTA